MIRKVSSPFFDDGQSGLGHLPSELRRRLRKANSLRLVEYGYHARVLRDSLLPSVAISAEHRQYHGAGEWANPTR